MKGKGEARTLEFRFKSDGTPEGGSFRNMMLCLPLLLPMILYLYFRIECRISLGGGRVLQLPSWNSWKDKRRSGNDLHKSNICWSYLKTSLFIWLFISIKRITMLKYGVLETDLFLISSLTNYYSERIKQILHNNNGDQENVKQKVVSLKQVL